MTAQPVTDSAGAIAGLLTDAAATLAAAPRRTPQERFEAEAWAALLHRVGAPLLTRACAPSHLTASAVIVDPPGAHTCLVLHGRIGLWVQPGGHLEDGDLTVAGAAAREAQEETGVHGLLLERPIALHRHRAPCRPDEVDWHLDVQFALLAEPGATVLSAESRDVRWWPMTALAGLAEREQLAPGVLESVALARAAALADPAAPAHPAAG